jgi:hypothetical protein
MQSLSRRLIIVPGLVGALAITIGALITAFPYAGDLGQSYSPFNHFISELGDTQQSALAAVFNIALIISGLTFGVFMVGVGLKFGVLLRLIISIGGALVGIFGALVGVFPMDVNLPAHRAVALGFFEGALLLLIVFALVVGVGPNSPYPRWTALATLPMIISNALFVFLVLRDGESALAAPEGGRETFWIVTMSEWGVLIFLLAWVTALTIWQIAHPDR